MRTNVKLVPGIAMPFLSLLAMLFLLTSCQLDTPTPPERLTEPGLENPVELRNGRLVIDSRADYDKLMNFFYQTQMNKADWTRWKAQFEGFESMKEAYDNLTEAEMDQIDQTLSTEGFESFLLIRNVDGELEAETHVPNPFLAELVNREGILQIGSVVEKHFYDHKIVLRNPSESDIAALATLKMGDRPSQGEWLPIERNDLGAGARAGNNNCKNEYAGSPKRRINATWIFEKPKFYTPGIGYAWDHYFFSEVKNQRRNLRIWWARTANELRTTGTASSGNASWNSTWGGPFDYSEEDEKNIKYLAGYYQFQPSPTPQFTTNFSASNSVEDNSGKTGSCSNNMYY